MTLNDIQNNPEDAYNLILELENQLKTAIDSMDRILNLLEKASEKTNLTIDLINNLSKNGKIVEDIPL